MRERNQGIERSFRKPTKVRHEPLATITEIAAQLNVSASHLRTMLKQPSGPKPRLKTKNITYFAPSEVRAWWKAKQELT